MLDTFDYAHFIIFEIVAEIAALSPPMMRCRAATRRVPPPSCDAASLIFVAPFFL